MEMYLRQTKITQNWNCYVHGYAPNKAMPNIAPAWFQHSCIWYPMLDNLLRCSSDQIDLVLKFSEP